MARRTAAAETEELMKVFFSETEQDYIIKIKATRQPKRRKVMLAELDALDAVKGRFYHWINGVNT